MAKQSQLDKAIANLEAQIEVLELAREKLREQQQKKSAQKPKKAPKPEAVA